MEFIKFINLWMEIDPPNFPLAMARTLVALFHWSEESVRKEAVLILCSLAIKNTELSVEVGAISVLCESITVKELDTASEIVLSRMIYLLNEPKKRNAIIGQFQVQSIFAHFTDIERAEGTNRIRGGPSGSEEGSLRLARQAIITLFKNWSSLIYLGWEKRSLKSLIEALRQPVQPIVRKHIFELLAEIIKMGVNLCPKETENTPHNIRRYLSQIACTQTRLLLDAGTYEVLLELSSIDDLDISSQALKLLKDFTYMMYNLVPLDEVTSPDFLMNSIPLNNPRYDYIKSKCSCIYENMSGKM